MIDLTIHRQALDRNIQKARESGIFNVFCTGDI